MKNVQKQRIYRFSSLETLRENFVTLEWDTIKDILIKTLPHEIEGMTYYKKISIYKVKRTK